MWNFENSRENWKKKTTFQQKYSISSTSGMWDMALISGMDDDVNLLVDNIKKNTGSLIDASKEGDLEANTENT